MEWKGQGEGVEASWFGNISVVAGREPGRSSRVPEFQPGSSLGFIACSISALMRMLVCFNEMETTLRLMEKKKHGNSRTSRKQAVKGNAMTVT